MQCVHLYVLTVHFMSSFAQEQAVDPRTRLLMYKMVNAGILENINGCISTGKESVVFHANGGRCVLCVIICATRLSLAINTSVHLLSGCLSQCVSCSFEEKIVPEECVLKVFKTTLNEFKNRDKYIKDDYRFKDRFSKLNPRKIIHLWAEKEMHNLTRWHTDSFNCTRQIFAV